MELVTTPDQLLLKKISLDDTDAFSEFFDGYWEPLFQYAYKVLQNKPDAEEIVQDFFVHLWNRRRELPELHSVSAYLFTGLKNRLLNHFAKKKYQVKDLSLLKGEESHLSANDHLEKKDAENNIRSLAELLPQKMQEVYLLHQFRGLSVAEIASATGNSEQTIRNQLSTAVRKLSVAYRNRLCSVFLLSVFFYHIFNF